MNKLYLVGCLLLAQLHAGAQCPVILDCSAQTDTFPAWGVNDTFLWNTFPFYHQHTGSNNLAEAGVDLNLTVVDTCAADSVHIGFILELDLDDDNQRETLLFSDNLPQNPGMFQYNNLNGQGLLRAFDNRNIPDSEKYAFRLALNRNGDTLSAGLCWSTSTWPDTCITPLLPLGTHRIRWMVRYGATADTCVQEFTVRDAAPPVPVCAGAQSQYVTINGFVSLNIADFLTAVSDNTNPENLLQISMVESPFGNGSFPYDCDGNPVFNLTYSCVQLGVKEIQVWARDLAGNTGYCTTTINILDNLGNCAGFYYPKLDLCIYTENGLPVPGAYIYGEIINPDMPYYFLFPPANTDTYGCIRLFYPQPYPGSVLITPTKDDDPLNGITTFDLFLLSKHILGIDTLPTIFRKLAADVTRSNSITTYDIVELRKLILGINAENLYSNSWRFIDKMFPFEFFTNPLEAPEWLRNDDFGPCSEFIGIKVGDLNLSADPSGAAGPADDRGPARPLLMPDETLKAGETVEIPLQLPGNNAWSGAQFALRFDPALLDIEAVTPGDLSDFSDDNYALFPDRLHLSWVAPTGATGNTLAHLRVRALRDCRPSEVFSLDNSFMQAEAYTAAATQHDLALAFGERATSVQAWPNPTRGAAHIAFTLPQAGAVTLRVSDATGKLLYETTADLPVGEHNLEIPASATASGGVFFWWLSAPASGKLVRW